MYAEFIADRAASVALYSEARAEAFARMGFGDLIEARASWSKLSF